MTPSELAQEMMYSSAELDMIIFTGASVTMLLTADMVTIDSMVVLEPIGSLLIQGIVSSRTSTLAKVIASLSVKI